MSILTPEDVASKLGCSESEAISRMRLTGRMLKLGARMPRMLDSDCHLLTDDLSVIAAGFLPRKRWAQVYGPGCGPLQKDFVYFMGVDDRFVKIGFSADVHRRLATIQRANPSHVSLLAVLHGCKQYEQDLHARFSSSRVHFEWFRREGELAKLLEMAP